MTIAHDGAARHDDQRSAGDPPATQGVEDITARDRPERAGDDADAADDFPRIGGCEPIGAHEQAGRPACHGITGDCGEGAYHQERQIAAEICRDVAQALAQCPQPASQALFTGRRSGRFREPLKAA